jgi:hypothetical protein
MDTIIVNEGSDEIQIVEASDGVPVSITEEKISVNEFGIPSESRLLRIVSRSRMRMILSPSPMSLKLSQYNTVKF